MANIKKYLTTAGLGLSLLFSTGCDAGLLTALTGAGGTPEDTTSGRPDSDDDDLGSDSGRDDDGGSSGSSGSSSGSSGSSSSDDFEPDDSDSSGSDTNFNPGGNPTFDRFLNSNETYFGPATSSGANMGSSLSGNDAAGSRWDGAVGVLVTVRGDRGYMRIVNLDNGREFPVNNSSGSPFSVVADTLGGKPFPSIFVTFINAENLVDITFEHRSSTRGVCTYYKTSFSGSAASGVYTANEVGSGDCSY